MALKGSDQHLTERDCGLNSEQISRCGAVKKHIRATSRWLSTTAIAVCALVTTRCSIWMITLIDELHQRRDSNTLWRSWPRASGSTARSAERESLAN